MEEIKKKKHFGDGIIKDLTGNECKESYTDKD